MCPLRRSQHHLERPQKIADALVKPAVVGSDHLRGADCPATILGTEQVALGFARCRQG
jgi:hypothetical protein